MRERWLPVVGYEGLYEVSDHGRVRSLDRTVSSPSRSSYEKRGRILRPQTTHDGYYAVHLCQNGKERRHRINILVLEAFVAPKPFSSAEGNHKDGVKTNNTPANLEWCTPRENRLHALKTGLADMSHLVRFRKAGYQTLHSLLMKPPNGFVVDHINGDTLDNRRNNLRVCTNKQNVRNMRKHRGTSKYKGVRWAAHAKQWAAVISPNGKTYHLGYSKDERDCAVMYDIAAQLFYGPYARLNNA